MEKLRMQTVDPREDNIRKISEMFPNCITEIKEENAIRLAIDFEKLKKELSPSISNSKESYQFTWPEKSKYEALATDATNKTLRPDKKNSINYDKTKNLYIEGDNLDVLRILKNTYLNRIKMIYIDPPYNTGSDLIYEDKFTIDSEKYNEIDGNVDDEGNRLTQNTVSNGRFHTDWLNMIYPRLKIARDLLTKDGVIFISIDDHEIANLLKVCEDIFGYRNIEVLIWNKEAEGSSGTLKVISTVRRNHEYIVCAYKKKDIAQFNKVREALKGKENVLETANLAVNSSNEKTDHPNYFTITNPSGDQFTRQWKWDKKEIDRLIKEDLIYWGSDGHKQPRVIIPTDDRRTTYLQSILNYGGTTVGRKDFEEVMGKECEFSYPKPIILLKKLIETSTNEEDTVMDFFSGSASTAQAVIELNKEMKSKRNFILVQYPDEQNPDSVNYKLGYKTLCDIGRKRIENINQKFNNDDTDSGFRRLICDSSNMKDVYYKPSETEQKNLEPFLTNIKEDRTEEDLLYQVMLELGIELSSKIETYLIDNKKIYSVDDDYLIACFDENISETIITEMAKKSKCHAVVRESSIDDDSTYTNFEQIFKAINPTITPRVL